LLEESAELRALREIDLALFSTEPSSGSPWPAEEPPRLDRDAPLLIATGLPPQAPLPALLAPPPTNDLTWLRSLQLPDIPVRWDVRVIRYLEFYKTNPRGRSMAAGWVKKSGRYGAFMRRTLREQGVPEDVLWLALVESGFDPTIHSPVGAAGLWQFMPEGARIYGLTVDRWVDERLDPERSTIAAARYLSDLHRRFGNWELAFAAYNMGYGGLLAAIRKYGTNDFWELGRLEAGLPLETALYVPKILAMAIVAKNCAVFGCDGVDLDSAVTFDKITVGSGVSLRVVANAAGADPDAVAALNPQYPIGRTPPLPVGTESNATHVVRVPAGTGPVAAKSVTTLVQREDKLDHHIVRWGESLEDIATAVHTTRSSILSLNGFRTSEQVRPGTVLLVPARGAAITSGADSAQSKPVVVVPAEKFVYPSRRRVFYRIVAGDTPREIASALSIPLGELCRWNSIDQSATLHDGMVLQAFIPKAAVLSHALVTEEENARVLAVGSPEFFEHFESLKGRKRIEIVVGEADNWRSLSKRYGLSLGMLERINHRSRSSVLTAGEKIVVYVAAAKVAPSKAVPGPSEAEPLEEKPEQSLPGAIAAADPAGSGEGNGESAAPVTTPDDPSDAAPASEPVKESAPTISVKVVKDEKPAKTAKASASP
jgi:membrane-bound lytic murein transglycosylase D